MLNVLLQQAGLWPMQSTVPAHIMRSNAGLQALLFLPTEKHSHSTFILEKAGKRTNPTAYCAHY